MSTKNAKTVVWTSLIALWTVFWAITANGQPDSRPPSPPADNDPSSQYLIGAGDTLQVFVWRQPELSATVPVRPDGRISTPLVEDLVAVGKTATQLAREIEQVLSEYVRNPEVNVIIQQFVGASGAQIRVLGQVKQPQSVPYRDRLTLMDAVIQVGGLTDFAAGNRAKLVRNVNGKSQEKRIKLEDLMKGKIENDVPLQPGDVIIVPEAVF